MKIIKCHIENFGKLSDASFDFSEGCNVFCEDNGWGKSTLSAFIKVMFYGFDGETKKKLIDKEREIYRPWQGGVYGGQLTFEVAGHTYTMHRTFGKKDSEDEFILKDETTNLVSDAYSTRIGEELFKIDSESFKRTVYISQNDCKTMTTDSINAKIGNLAENTDDINNYENVDGKLKDILNSMTPRRATGSLNKLKKSIAELMEVVKEAESVDKSMEEVTTFREAGKERLNILKCQRDELADTQRKMSAYKDIQVKKEKYISLTEEYNVRLSEYEDEKAYFSNGLPNEASLTSAMDRASRLEGLSQSVRLYEPTAEEQIKYENNYREEFANKDMLDKDIHRILSLWNDRNAKKSMLGAKRLEVSNYRLLLENSRNNRANTGNNSNAGGNGNNMVSSTYGKMLFIISGILGIIGIVLAFMNNYVGLAVIVAGIICGIVGLIGNTSAKNKSDANEIKANEEYMINTEDEIKASEEYIINTENEIKADEEYIINTENEVKAFFDKYSLTYIENDIATELYGFRNLIKDCTLIHEKLSKYNMAKESYIKERDEVYTFIRNVGFTPSDNVSEQLREMYDRYRKVALCKQEFIKVQKSKEEFEKSEDVTKLMKDIAIPDNTSIEEITDRLNQLHSEMEAINESISSYNKTLDDYRIKRDYISEKEIELNKFKDEYEEGLKKYNLIEKTKEFLNEAKTSFTAKYMQPIMSGFEKYYELIAKTDATLYSIDANTRLFVNEKGMPRDVSSLSTGYQDMIGICMRMALVDAMYKDEKPFVIFDDPFVNLDETKTNGGMDFIKDISKEYQVIYFTCHKSRV